MNEMFKAVIKSLPIYSGITVHEHMVGFKLPNARHAKKTADEAKELIKSMNLPLEAIHPDHSETFFIKTTQQCNKKN